MERKRIDFIDLAKIMTMMIVCYDHVCQNISPAGAFDAVFFVGSISFHMPLFMVLSGMCFRFEKGTDCYKQIHKRFMQLIVPALVWYFIQCILFFKEPDIKSSFESYWFLTCLFICNIIFLIVHKFHRYLPLITCFIIPLIPYSSFVKVNFLLPYLLLGFYIRKYSSVFITWHFGLISCILFLILYQYWTFDYSVYVTPIKFIGENNILHVSLVALYRFIIGALGSIFIIYLSQIMCKYIIFNNVKKVLCYAGRHTLSIYIIHYVFLEVIRLYFKKHSINGYYSIELLSFLLSILIICLCLIIDKILSKNRYFKLILLGKYK